MRSYLKIFLLCLIVFISGCTAKKEVSAKEEKQEETAETEPEVLTPEEEKEQFLEWVLSNMTTEEKIGQLFMVAFRQDKDGNPILSVNEEMKAVIEDYHLGGVILFGENIDTKEQTKTLIYDLQKAGGGSLFIAVDEEGGRVSRLSASGKIDAYKVPSAGSMAKDGNPQTAYEMYKIIGGELKELGFNLDFAPVADINTNPENPVIGDRAFGSDPVEAGEFVAKAVEGLKEEDIYSALKHFPGHGDTTTDSHKGETVVSHDLERLFSVETVPFQMGIQAGAEFVMVSHIKVPNATTKDLPASMSEEIVQGILRDKMGYDKLVITDAMNMGAISQYYDSKEAAVLAIGAGVDIVLMPEDLDSAFSAVKEAVLTGEISMERLDESVRRILWEKYEKGLTPGQ